MAHRLTKFWRRITRGRTAASSGAGGNDRDVVADLKLRRWEAAQLSRLNSGHWQPATGASLNRDLVDRLGRLRAHADLELSINPDLEGIVNQNIIDVIGEEGPTLQLSVPGTEIADGERTVSPQEQWCRQMESIWWAWWLGRDDDGVASPDAAGLMTGPELLGMWWRGLWTDGDLLGQVVTDNAATTPIKLRIAPIAPRRLITPMTAVPDVLMGVERNRLGKPVAYWIDDDLDTDVTVQAMALSPRRIPARDILHGFRVLEAGQARGVPWLATGLQVAADLHDYDAQVMDAARAAADAGAYMYTDSPDVEVQVMEGSHELQRRRLDTLPPGYKLAQMVPQQPSTQYETFYDTQLRKLGKPVSMPLMIIKQDSRRMSYSAARFDGQLYWRAVRYLRGWLTRLVLDRLYRLVQREAVLARLIGPPPEGLEVAWGWTGAVQGDPVKEAAAATERLDNGTATLRDECALVNRDWAEAIEQQERETAHRRRMRERYGNPEPMEPPAPSGGPMAVDDDEETTDAVDAMSEMVEAGGNGRMR